MPDLLAISGIIPTRNRPESLRRTLEAVALQSSQPREIIVNDRSEDDRTRELCEGKIAGLASVIRWQRATASGAAAQRNEACASAVEPFILFMDDDIVPEPDCFAKLWATLQGGERTGGVNSMITNQSFRPPGLAGRLLSWLLRAGKTSVAGRWLGGVLNVLPEASSNLPEVVPVEWLNTTCTLYRREALPDSPFPMWFSGYSLGEDLALSLEVKRRGWKLANARTARIFHDSQSGDHKRSEVKLTAMEMYNRWRIGREYSGLSRVRLAFNLALVQLYKLIAGLTSLPGLKKLPAQLAGNLVGWWKIFQGVKE